MELIPGGADTEVNASNVHDYVRKYAEYRMVTSAEKALEVSWHTGAAINSLSAELFWVMMFLSEDMNTYLGYYQFLNIEAGLAFEILCCGRQGPYCPYYVINIMMADDLETLEPGH